MAVAALAGCSSNPPEPFSPPQGQLIPGTAKLSVHGQDTDSTKAVQCTPAGPLMMIDTGTGDSGMSAMVSNAEGLVVRQVRINDVGGFTGSYNDGLGGEASVTMSGRTYHISGTAQGFATDNPSFRTSDTFALKVSC